MEHQRRPQGRTTRRQNETTSVVITMDKSAIINKIAKDVLFVNCLEERKLDRLDFHDVHVTRIEAALNKAFDVGFDVGFEFAKEEFDKR